MSNGKATYDAEANTWEPERHLADYGCRTLLDEFNAAYDKKHVQSHICRARNDDPAGRTTRLLEEAQATLDAYDHDRERWGGICTKSTRQAS